MNLSRILFLIVIIIQWSCENTISKEKNISSVFETKQLIEVDNLARILNDDNVIVVDLRKPEQYKEGHIPGAINIWRNDMENDSLAYGGMIAPKLKIEILFSKLGIDNNDFVVIYDNNASCDAARLWWVLDYYGYQKTALLNGGLKAWQKTGELSKEVILRKEASFKLPKEYISRRYIGHDEMANIYNNSGLIILDSRTADEYNGKYIKAGAFEQGRIPGSVNIDWAETMDYDNNQTFKNKNELKALYRTKGIDSASDVVVYCHSGVRSAHTTFVLTELLGYKKVRNYEGSWTEWSYHKMPFERDSLN
jgi:thiosulfate/3-mercaptopyruvate sulfurtransferase